MNEYNFNIEEIENADGMNKIPQQQKPPKKHTAMKIAASLMAMTLVSAGSIGVYRMIDRNNTAPAETVAVEMPTEAEKSDISVNTVSSINKASDEKTVLTTEEIVAKVMPSVVGVESKFVIEGQESYYNNFFGFDFGFGNQQQPQSQEATGTGTGFIISEDGYIVTNAHVIYDSQHGAELAKEIKVVHGDDNYSAEVVGYDVDSDIAVLKIDANGLTPAELGDSDKLNLGEDVTAIGNPLGFDLMNTVTRGIVSGLNRNITINDKSMNLIQTDAAINEGNSGGPLINKYGQVIGINSAKMSGSVNTSASVEGLCFAIPSNYASKIVDDLKSFGMVKGKPQLGISCQSVTETISEMYGMPVGVYVVEVTEGSAAEKAGLRKGDIITAADGETVKSFEELDSKKNLHKAGEEFSLTYTRNGEEAVAVVVLDEKSAE